MVVFVLSIWRLAEFTQSAAPSGSLVHRLGPNEMFVLFGVAEDHDSNPIKIGLGRSREEETSCFSESCPNWICSNLRFGTVLLQALTVY